MSRGRIEDERIPVGQRIGGFAVPQQLPPGTLEVIAIPADVVGCDDTGTNNRLKTTDDLDRTSCVIPIKLLQITR